MRAVLYFLKFTAEELRETQIFFHDTCLLAENRPRTYQIRSKFLNTLDICLAHLWKKSIHQPLSPYKFILEMLYCKGDANLRVDYGLVTVFWLLRTLRTSLPGARETRSTLLTCSKYENCVSLIEQSQKVQVAAVDFYQKWEALKIQRNKLVCT
jgi:hypothetical protein